MQQVMIDYAGNVQNAFDQGRRRRQEMETQRALQALGVNPQDPQALQALNRFNPPAAQDFKAKQESAAKARMEVIGRAAKEARTPEAWDQIATHLAQNGFPEAAQFVGKFSPALRSAFMAQGGVSDDGQAQDPSFIREADALGIPRDEAARLWKQKQGMVVINGIPHMAVPGTDQPAPVLTDEDILRMKGGQSGGSSAGGFQDPLAPL